MRLFKNKRQVSKYFNIYFLSRLCLISGRVEKIQKINFSTSIKANFLLDDEIVIKTILIIKNSYIDE